MNSQEQAGLPLALVPSSSLLPCACRESWVGSMRSLWLPAEGQFTQEVAVHQKCWLPSGVAWESSKGPSWLPEACWLLCSSPCCSEGEQGLKYQQSKEKRSPEQALQSVSTKGPVVAPSTLLTRTIRPMVEAPRVSHRTWVSDLSTEVCLTQEIQSSEPAYHVS